MIDPDLFEDFVKRDKHNKKKFIDNRINSGFINSNIVNLDELNSGVRTGDSALGKLTKKLEGFNFKDEKNKKSKFKFFYIVINFNI